MQALRDLEVLDSSPDAKPLVGDDALPSARTKGAECTANISLTRTGDGWLRRASVAFSAPLIEGQPVLAERRAERMSQRPHARFDLTDVVVPATGHLIASCRLAASAGRRGLSSADTADLGNLPR